MGTGVYHRTSELESFWSTVESHGRHMLISVLNRKTEPFNLTKT